MREKPYYSVRTGKNIGGAKLDLDKFRRLFASIYKQLESDGYFQEFFGYQCVDQGFVPGRLGSDIEGEIILQLGKSGLWPIPEMVEDYTEDDLFDVIEFLHEHVSKGVKGWNHTYGDCGMHWSKFDREAGRAEYREKVNRILQKYDGGYELSEDGEILSLPQSGLKPLLEEPLPSIDPININARVEAAVRKYRLHSASEDDKRGAIRDLADVLEFLRPELRGVLSSGDEDDLFNIVNNFGIRHHKKGQKIEYDKAIWYDWLFNYYLAAIHGVVRLLAKGKSKPN